MSEEELFRRMNDNNILDYLKRHYVGQSFDLIKETDPYFADQLEVRGFLEQVVNRNEKVVLRKIIGLQNKLDEASEQKNEKSREVKTIRYSPKKRKINKNPEQIKKEIIEQVKTRFYLKSICIIRKEDPSLCTRIKYWKMGNYLIEKGYLVK
jgi:hypothetical protein